MVFGSRCPGRYTAQHQPEAQTIISAEAALEAVKEIYENTILDSQVTISRIWLEYVVVPGWEETADTGRAPERNVVSTLDMQYFFFPVFASPLILSFLTGRAYFVLKIPVGLRLDLWLQGRSSVGTDRLTILCSALVVLGLTVGFGVLFYRMIPQSPLNLVCESRLITLNTHITPTNKNEDARIYSTALHGWGWWSICSITSQKR